MFRTISLVSVCLILASTSSAVAQKPFKNKTALTAKTSFEKERKRIEAAAANAIAKAKKEYVAKLEVAIKEAGGAGDIDEANRLVAEKKTVESDEGGAIKNPFERLRKKIEGTTWSITGTTVTLRFGKNGTAIDSRGTKLAWSTDGKNALVLQSQKSTNIYVWQLDKNVRVAAVTAFIKGKVYPPNRRIVKKRR